MNKNLEEALEECKELENIKAKERLWVESICEKEVIRGEAMDYSLTVDRLVDVVTRNLDKYPDEEFYLMDWEVERICQTFLEDDFVKEKMSRVD